MNKFLHLFLSSIFWIFSVLPSRISWMRCCVIAAVNGDTCTQGVLRQIESQEKTTSCVNCWLCDSDWFKCIIQVEFPHCMWDVNSLWTMESDSVHVVYIAGRWGLLDVLLGKREGLGAAWAGRGMFLHVQGSVYIVRGACPLPECFIVFCTVHITCLSVMRHPELLCCNLLVLYIANTCLRQSLLSFSFLCE